MRLCGELWVVSACSALCSRRNMDTVRSIRFSRTSEIERSRVSMTVSSESLSLVPQRHSVICEATRRDRTEAGDVAWG